MGLLNGILRSCFCSGCAQEEGLTYGVLLPEEEMTAVFENGTGTLVDSVTECARLCLEHECTVAGYQPASPGASPQTGVCLISLEKQSFEVTCSQALARHRQYETKEPVFIVCIRCGTILACAVFRLC